MEPHSFERPHFVVNGRARPAGAPHTMDDLRAAALRAFPAARWAATSAPGDAVALARDAASDGADLVVAVGGDGTVNEVVNGLLTAPVPPPPLGIVPAGSGSDFIRSLGLPRDATVALDALRCGRRRRIDAGQILCAPLSPPDSDARVRRYFVNMAGCGASAEVARRFNRRHIPGAVGYAVASALTTFNFSWPQVEIRLDGGGPRHVTLNALFVCNGQYCGGGMRVGRGACVDNGRLLVIEAADMSRLRTILEWPRLYRGRLEHVAGLRVRSADCVSVTSPDEVLVDCDGEVCGRLPATYSVLPGALTVYVPDPAR